MARRRQTEDVVDGFTTLKAAQLAASKGARPGKTKPPTEEVAPPREPEIKPVPVAQERRIAHTAQPTRHDVVCYECGFAFLLTGQLRNTYCPKCRSILEAGEQTIDGEWTGIVKTIGVVRITATGVVKDGKIATSEVILAGSIEGGKVQAFGRLEVCAGGKFVPEALEVRNLVIGVGAIVRMEKVFSLKNVEIFGELNASINATGLVALRAGCFFNGEVSCHHLVVDDGARMVASLKITPEEPAGDNSQNVHIRNKLIASEHRRSAA